MFRRKLRAGELDDTMIELEVADTSNPFRMIEIPGQPQGMGMGMMNLGDHLRQGLRSGAPRASG
jgi:ATP-dependent HslUV protease ATP-binding subunit HslU